MMNYSFLVFTLRYNPAGIAVLMTTADAKEFIRKWYSDELPQHVHGTDLNNMCWAIDTSEIQALWTKAYEQTPPQAPTTPPGVAAPYKPYTSGGRN